MNDFFKTVIWQSADDVFSTMLPLPIEKAADCQIIESTIALASTITFAGQIQGSFSIICPFDNAQQLAKTMLMTPEDETLADNEIFDALGEITNMILGGIKTRIADSLPQMNISVPICVKGCEINPFIGKNTTKIIVSTKVKDLPMNLIFIYKNNLVN